MTTIFTKTLALSVCTLAISACGGGNTPATTGGGAAGLDVQSGGAGSGGSGTPSGGAGGSSSPGGGGGNNSAAGRDSGTAGVDSLPPSLNPTDCAKPGGTAMGTVTGTPGTWENVTPKEVTLVPSMFNNDNFGVQDVLVDPVRPSDAYAFICHQGVWKTQDYGSTWKKVNTGTLGADIDGGKPWSAGINSNRCRDPNTPPTLYTLSGGGSKQGFYKSNDGGVNWEHVTLPPQSSTQYPQDAYSIAVNPYAGGHLLMGFHEAVGLIESTDGGATWQPRKPADDGVSVYFTFVDTGDPATTAKTWISVGQSGATFRTADGGATWTQVEKLVHGHGCSQIFQAGGGVLYIPGTYGSSGNGVYRSTDYGLTFTKAYEGVANNVIGTSTTLYSSYAWANSGTVDPSLHTAPRDPGTAWVTQTAPAGMTNGAKGSAATSDGTRNIVLTGNWNAGIWRYIEP